MWVAKGILLSVWLFSFGTIAYLYLAIFRTLPPGTGAVGVTVFSGYTIQNPFWWGAMIACLALGLAITHSWPGKTILWIALGVTELIPAGLLVLFLMVLHKMNEAAAR